jgi:hypothetical protein
MKKKKKNSTAAEEMSKIPFASSHWSPQMKIIIVIIIPIINELY